MEHGNGGGGERLTEYERLLLSRARSLSPSRPPWPWEREWTVPASGVLACGWDAEEHLVLLSGSGYSITDVRTGERLHRDRNADEVYDRLAQSMLRFTVPYHGQTIDIFGFEAGDGIHLTGDGWSLKTIYPWWPRASVILEQVFAPGYRYLEQAAMIDPGRLDGDIRCGFSPSGRHFVILGSGGAVGYSRA